MLHVTNGSIVVMRLHDLGLPGRAVAWDDVLHEGPVRSDLDPGHLRDERAAFLASCGWGTVDEVRRHLTARDETVAAAVAADDEIVLWFEHDLYDQLHVLQVLNHLKACDRSRVTAVFSTDYLSPQPPERLQAWFDARQALSAVQWESAARAWQAFGSANPQAVADLVTDVPALSSLGPALTRHLQQFPSVRTGLSRTERQTLAAVANGIRMPRDVFVAANHRAEEAIFMGDSVWLWHIRPLLTGPRPLLRVEGSAPPSFTDPAWWEDDDTAPRLRLTDDGERVAAGEADHIALNGIDRWLGGVHLTGPVPQWRWDDTHGTLVNLQTSL